MANTDSLVSHFNPRSREGSDLDDFTIGLGNTISIHAPVKGATVPPDTADCRASNFNPRSREGSDLERARSILVL